MTRIGIEDITQALTESLGGYEIPFDFAVVKPPTILKKRIRPYAIALPQLGGVEWTSGYDDLRMFKAVVVVVLFTDVAADYFIRADMMPAARRILAERFGDEVIGGDYYMTSRKEIAALSRLGRIGKNSLFFSRRFGFNCKIDLVFLNADVDGANEISSADNWKLDACTGCNICVDSCPVAAYDEFVIHDPLACERHITPDWHQPERMCRTCITSCPLSERVLEHCHEEVSTPYAVYENGRRDSEMFAPAKGLELDYEGDGVTVSAEGARVTFSSELAPALEWIAGRRSSFSAAEFSLRNPGVAVGRVKQLLSILSECEILRPGG